MFRKESDEKFRCKLKNRMKKSGRELMYKVASLNVFESTGASVAFKYISGLYG